ncbi:hypothetical protein DLM_3870 [Aquitalea magnusonii]|uniref:Uncharacterized protein n=1 Tax=Aquitalea magnusonii TaxID=332411 RepID=A0A3G9GLP0_9NEIS|nr:hypothetical protein DLM_3870 [Aquitalea magnusonii]
MFHVVFLDGRATCASARMLMAKLNLPRRGRRWWIMNLCVNADGHSHKLTFGNMRHTVAQRRASRLQACPACRRTS